MKAPERPANEQDRIRQLYRLDILDTPPEAMFDDFTRLAAMLCKTRFSTVSLIDDERQWFKSVAGPLDTRETEREVSFCGHAILGDDLFIVEDARADERFHDNPVVTDGSRIRFYAGAPLITREGAALGTLCVFDPSPGSLSDSQQEGLRLLAKQVSERIEQRLSNTLLEHLGTLLNFSKSYVLMFDPYTEQISYINPELSRRLGEQLSGNSRRLAGLLFPDLDYDRFLSPERLSRNQGEHRRVTRVRFPDLVDGQAELRILPHLSEGRRTCVLLFNDQSELSRTRLQAKQAQSNLRVFSKVAMQSRNAVLITDPQERIEWVNESFERLTGYTSAEVIGKVPGDLLQGEETSPKDRERIRRHIDEGHPVVQDILNYDKDGHPYWVEIYIEPVRDDSGGITHFVASQNDITHRKEQELAVRASRAAAERSSRAKSQFLANISHELRTPLNGIMGVTEHLLEAVPESLRDQVTTLDQSSRHLLSLLNELIDLSRIESGEFTLNTEPFVLPDLLQEVEHLFQPRAEAAATTLEVYYDGEPTDTYLGDATRLRQVLINLVNNAVKFTVNGEVSVRVTRDPDSEPDQISLNFSVTDTGPGIPAEDQHRIFESFEQLDNSPTRVHGGSGLGLAISRQIVRAMGSDIKLESREGLGARFSFCIPLAQAGAAAPMADTPDKPLHPVSHALVIDDNEVNRAVLENLLRRRGMKAIYSASTARQGLTLVENLQPGILFVDLHMPGMDGLEFLSVVRRTFAEQGRNLPPTIACTADVDDEHRRQCLAAGFDEHLGKPVGLPALNSVLDRLGLTIAGAHRGTDAAPQREEPSAKKHQTLPPEQERPDIDRLKHSFLGDEELLKEFLGLLQENLPVHIGHISEALRIGNIASHYEAAHSIKGLVGYFESAWLTGLVSELETAMKHGDLETARARFSLVQPTLDGLMKDIGKLLRSL